MGIRGFLEYTPLPLDLCNHGVRGNLQNNLRGSTSYGQNLGKKEVNEVSSFEFQVSKTLLLGSQYPMLSPQSSIRLSPIEFKELLSLVCRFSKIWEARLPSDSGSVEAGYTSRMIYSRGNGWGFP